MALLGLGCVCGEANQFFTHKKRRHVMILSKISSYTRSIGAWCVYSISLCLASETNALVVLQYHHISDQSPQVTSTSPELFKAQMALLDEQGFTVLPLERLPKLLEAAGERGARLPDKTVMITFDDGYRSIYNNAWPELKKRNWPFTVFVNSQPHDEKKALYMSWEQLRELASNGVSIANHSDSHPHLVRRRQDESEHQWQQRRMQEILFAEKRIKAEIGRSLKMFAYPYGEYDATLLDVLASNGYLAFGQQSGPVSASSHPQLIPRFPFGGEYGAIEDFSVKVNTLPFPHLKVELKDSKGRNITNPELPAGEFRPIMELRSPILGFPLSAQCFATAQGPIEAEIKGGALVARAQRPLNVGRSRYNCTAAAGGGRFYWYSQLFMRRKTDGSWYEER